MDVTTSLIKYPSPCSSELVLHRKLLLNAPSHSIQTIRLYHTMVISVNKTYKKNFGYDDDTEIH